LILRSTLELISKSTNTRLDACFHIIGCIGYRNNETLQLRGIRDGVQGSGAEAGLDRTLLEVAALSGRELVARARHALRHKQQMKLLSEASSNRSFGRMLTGADPRPKGMVIYVLEGSLEDSDPFV